MSKSVYEMVTERIIEQLESGVIPWEKPWSGVRSGAYNRISKRSYSLLNQMLLKNEGEYATFKQWSEFGGKIKKGEKSEIVVFWKILPIEETQEDGTKVIKQVPLLKYINVFHISQVEGVEPLQKEKLNDIEPIEQAESILDARSETAIASTTNSDMYIPDMIPPQKVDDEKKTEIIVSIPGNLPLHGIKELVRIAMSGHLHTILF